MTYSLIIEHNNSDPSYVLNIKTWGEVTNYLKHKLDQWTIRVKIHKYSSDNKLLGEKCVAMGNLYFVAGSPTDKVLL
jgi:hypothetical protein